MSQAIEIPESDYHADIGLGVPRLSKSRAQRLLTRSAGHVFAEHPVLNPAWVAPEEEPRFDLGNAVHSLVLEGVSKLVRLDDEFTDFKTKAAREIRDQAYRDGKIPMLGDQFDRTLEMVEAIWTQLPAFKVEPALFREGRPEVTILWRCHRGVDWKARLDWLVLGPGLAGPPLAIHDLKTTKVTAAPERWSKAMSSIGADMQSVIYREGVKAVYGVDVPMTFVAVETYPPYAISVHDLSPEAERQARERVDFAAETWKRCLETGVWPTYPTQVCYAEPTGYGETAFYERMYRDEEPS